VAAPAAVALVAGDRVQPGPQPLRVTQLGDPLGGDDQRVVQDVRGRVSVLQLGNTKGVEGVGVPLVELGPPLPVAFHDGADKLRVLHDMQP
jgi:hypothetical protein